MIKIILSVLCILSSALLHASQDDKSTLTATLMHLVKNSTSIKRGSSKWKNYIQKDSAQVETTLTENPQRLYTGAAAYFYYLTQIENTASGNFTISNKDGYVDIIGTIAHTAIEKVEPEAVKDYSVAKYNIDDLTRTESDGCSTCTFIPTTYFNAKNHQLEITLRTQCTTRMPFDEFVKALNMQQTCARIRIIK